MGRKTVKSSSRIRAQRAGQSDNVVPGRRGKAQDSPINEQDEDVYGVLLSERRRSGDNTPGLITRRRT
ncbi:MAG TPA: hypothetical protein VKT72_00310 [Candidatus Baltobacteraceae bacterium]|nr:hypothetical protein [Candidatus Baltobacteraceae bacterium]